MILRGQLEQSLGGFVCIRGYATMGELARISHADMTYQRDLMKEHSETVIRFLRNKQDLFFPEVILSCVLRYDFDKKGAESGLDPIALVLTGKKFKSNVDGISVSVKDISYQGREDARAATKLKLGSLVIPKKLESVKPSPLFRIDGNHRLSAADKGTEFKGIVAPFCVILFGTGADDTRSSKTIFHNINSKSIPLTFEENYRIVLDDVDLFPDDMLRDSPSFGWPFLLARKAKPSIEPAAVPALKDVLKHPRTALVDLFKLLIEKKAIKASEKELPDVQACFTKVQSIYNADEDLKTNHCIGLFHAFVYFCLTDAKDGRLKPFQHWVKGNHLAAMKETNAQALIEIFERVHTARQRTIFISMQFGDKTTATYKTIKKAVEQINKDCQPKIKLEELRIDQLNKGHSYTITDEILKAIEDSGLLIADLTWGNKNVYHEVGYLMGLNRGRRAAQDNFVLIVRDTDKEQVDKDVGFNLKGVSQIRFKEMNDLEEELTRTIRTYYGLGNG
ncbi:MAG: hypothetical protein K2X32_12070 [Phycisphaerales bacterium]|nr:hypothetical protein [Phycisphaerales bacterium]